MISGELVTTLKVMTLLMRKMQSAVPAAEREEFRTGIGTLIDLIDRLEGQLQTQEIPKS